MYDIFRTIHLMGFKDAKQRVFQCLKAGKIQHEARNEIDVKNLMLVGLVTVDEVVRMIGLTRGNQYKSSPHHLLPEIEVHEFKPEIWNEAKTRKEKWYLKCYFIEPDVIFISVHKS